MSDDDLKPGRELDALVAEKVMGKKTELYSGHLVFACSDYIVFACSGPSDLVYPLDYLVPHYSTDIAAAWKVIERVIYLNPQNKEYWLIRNAPFEKGAKKWGAGFEDEYPDCFDFFFSETVPHAICLAALKAITTKT